VIIFLALAIIGVAWVLRRSAGSSVERAMRARLPIGADGIVEGARGITRTGSPTRGVLILHGFGDTPQTLHYLADHLHGLGFTVHAPLLPGHGRTLAEFAATDADAWLEAATREFNTMRRAFDFVGIIGVSMGGALSVIIASRSKQMAPASGHGTGRPGCGGWTEQGPDALVLLAPYLSMRPRADRLAALHRIVSPFAQYLPSREEGSIRDPVERARNLGFGTVTPRLLSELRRVVHWAQQALPDVHQPTLVVQSRDDNRIEESAARRSFDRLGSREKRFVWTERGGHVITVDTGREHVLAVSGQWLLDRADGIAPHSPARTTTS
jgi:carboxylesterase